VTRGFRFPPTAGAATDTKCEVELCRENGLEKIQFLVPKLSMY
jgi:hypothetical protein